MSIAARSHRLTRNRVIEEVSQREFQELAAMLECPVEAENTTQAAGLHPPGAGALGAQRLSPDRLPVIDMEPLLRGNRRDRETVADQMGEAARTHGFFYILNPGISTVEVYEQAAAFFEQPLDYKLKFDIARSPNHRGYVPVTERGDYADEQGERHYEAFDSAFELASNDFAARSHYLMGPNVWPTLSGFREVVSLYYREMYSLGCQLCRAFELHLGLPEGYFDAHIRRPASQLRLLHYFEHENPPQETDMNMGAHTDYECFTLLHQSAPGLQVLDRRGRWIEAPPLEGTFVVNIGDMLEILTNGAFRSNVHRVVNSGRERFSVPFFFATDCDALIRPLPQFVGPGNPPRYAATVAGHHLMGQLMRDFSYLRARHARGDIKLDHEIPASNPFEDSKLAAAPLAA